MRTFDDDANTATPFGAGNAANLIAGRITTPTPGFFVYFNQGLDVPRLVFSTNLDDNTAAFVGYGAPRISPSPSW